ncbi:hypothetical protein [Aeromicrobium sp. PE09-221]|uniref:hypothetical protein n=1 Tax=Aeromicrobium sp. PE09-221 TaxID=1898043 RepID=UPI0014825C3D|nr:hypothetical protein [Aeromicrobium sp. PE09-221]
MSGVVMVVLVVSVAAQWVAWALVLADGWTRPTRDLRVHALVVLLGVQVVLSLVWAAG